MAQGDPKLPAIPGYTTRVTGGSAIPNPTSFVQPRATNLMKQFAGFSATLTQFAKYERSLNDAFLSGQDAGRAKLEADQRRRDYQAEEESERKGRAARLRSHHGTTKQLIADGVIDPVDDPLAFDSFVESGATKDYYKWQRTFDAEHEQRKIEDKEYRENPDAFFENVNTSYQAWLEESGMPDNDHWINKVEPLFDAYANRGDVTERSTANKNVLNDRREQSLDSHVEFLRSYIAESDPDVRKDILGQASEEFERARFGHISGREYDVAVVERLVTLALTTEDTDLIEEYMKALPAKPEDSGGTFANKRHVQEILEANSLRIETARIRNNSNRANSWFTGKHTELNTVPNEIYGLLDRGEIDAETAIIKLNEWWSNYDASLTEDGLLLLQDAEWDRLQAGGITTRSAMREKMLAKGAEQAKEKEFLAAIEQREEETALAAPLFADRLAKGLSPSRRGHHENVVEDMVRKLQGMEYADPKADSKDKKFTEARSREVVDSWIHSYIMEGDTAALRADRLVDVSERYGHVSGHTKSWMHNVVNAYSRLYHENSSFNDIEGSELEDAYKVYKAMRQLPGGEEVTKNLGLEGKVKDIFEEAYANRDTVPAKDLTIGFQRTAMRAKFTKGYDVPAIADTSLGDHDSLRSYLQGEYEFEPDDSVYAESLFLGMYAEEFPVDGSASEAFKRAEKSFKDGWKSKKTDSGSPYIVVGNIGVDTSGLAEGDEQLINEVITTFRDSLNHPFLEQPDIPYATAVGGNALNQIRHNPDLLDELRIAAGYSERQYHPSHGGPQTGGGGGYDTVPIRHKKWEKWKAVGKGGHKYDEGVHLINMDYMLKNDYDKVMKFIEDKGLAEGTLGFRPPGDVTGRIMRNEDIKVTILNGTWILQTKEGEEYEDFMGHDRVSFLTQNDVQAILQSSIDEQGKDRYEAFYGTLKQWP